MIPTLRLFIARHLPFFIPPGWNPDWFQYRMKRLTPSGEWEYREMTEAEAQEEFAARSW